MEASVETSRGKRRPTPLRRFIGSKRGQSLAEFALILPVLVLLMLGAIDFGRVFFAYVSVTNAARNGADYASFSSARANDLTGIRAAVVGDTGDLLNTSASNPQVTAATGTDSQGRLYADVTVTYAFSTLFPWPGIPDTVDVSRTVTARVAQ